MLRVVRAMSLVALAVISASACSSKSNTTPTNSNTVVFTATLLPQNEVPAITNADQSGTGTAQITFHLTRDASNNVTAATADYVVTMSNFPAGTTLTGAHIHNAVAGVNGGIVAQPGISSGEVVLANGSGQFTKTGVATDAPTAQSILNDPSSYYFNIHTTLNLNGAARGQLVKQG